jgi:hypothetical protein
MSPEEFDNRLKSAFKDENLPPREGLWANISSKLEPKAKTPFWYWLLPAIIAVTVGIVWVENQKTTTQEAAAIETFAIEPITASNPNTASKVESVSYKNNKAKTQTIELANRESNINTIQQRREKNGIIKASASNRSNRKISESLSITPVNQQNSYKGDHNNTVIALSNSDPIVENNDFGELDMLNFFRFSWFPNFFKPFALEESYSLDLKVKNPIKAQKPNSNKPPKTSDFTSKRWFTIGLGPQLAINSIKVNQDSQAWVHKHLWDNKDRLSSNGSGFQAFAHYALKFGKNQRFIFETGLNYSLRTEEIKLNESSYDIAARDNTGRINQYTQILLKVIYGNDTTYYLAASNFSLAVNNKYHILTVPFRLSAEHKISESTFMSYGLGGGFSMINSHNTEHLNMIWGNSVKERNSTQYSASLNANLSLYTNFNDIGQIGVYTGLQMYLNPWEVNSNQYAVNMRDLQMGITFRKPF